MMIGISPHLTSATQQTLQLTVAHEVLIELVGLFVIGIDRKNTLERLALTLRVVAAPPEICKLEPGIAVLRIALDCPTETGQCTIHPQWIALQEPLRAGRTPTDQSSKP